MQPAHNALFDTVAHQDYIDVKGQRGTENVVKFLKFKKNDISKATGQPKTSIRFDERAPKELTRRLIEIGNIINLVIDQFDGDIQKTELWFNTKNPLLGNISPVDMIRFGRYEKLQTFIFNARSGNFP